MGRGGVAQDDFAPVHLVKPTELWSWAGWSGMSCLKAREPLLSCIAKSLEVGCPKGGDVALAKGSSWRGTQLRVSSSHYSQ